MPFSAQISKRDELSLLLQTKWLADLWLESQVTICPRGQGPITRSLPQGPHLIAWSARFSWGLNQIWEWFCATVESVYVRGLWAGFQYWKFCSLLLLKLSFFLPMKIRKGKKNKIEQGPCPLSHCNTWSALMKGQYLTLCLFCPWSVPAE